MPSDEYWYGDVYLAKGYREAHKMRNEMKNQELWLQGLYNFSAFDVVLYNAFKKDSQKREEYFTKPIDIFGYDEEKRKKIEQEKAIAFFNNLAISLRMEDKNAD